MRIFIASRQNEQIRAQNIGRKLLTVGQQLSCSWLFDREVDDDKEWTPEELTQMCAVDFRDLAKSDCFLIVSPKRQPKKLLEGGPHGEMFGAALAFGKRIVLLGQPFAHFHHLSIVEVYADLEAFIENENSEDQE